MVSTSILKTVLVFFEAVFVLFGQHLTLKPFKQQLNDVPIMQNMLIQIFTKHQ